MEEKTPCMGSTLVWIDAFKVSDLVAHLKYGAQRYMEPQLLEAIRNFRALAAKGYETTLFTNEICDHRKTSIQALSFRMC